MSAVFSCPVCGTTIDDFRRTGLLGCAECYRVFRDEVLVAVRRVQGEGCHRGKVPATKAEKYALMRRQQKLKEMLEEAMRQGRYAEAEEYKRDLRENERLLREEER